MIKKYCFQIIRMISLVILIGSPKFILGENVDIFSSSCGDFVIDKDINQYPDRYFSDDTTLVVDKNISFKMGIEPCEYMNPEGTEYDAYVFVRKEDEFTRSYILNDAYITINNIQMRQKKPSFYRIDKGAGLILNTGDTVEVVIEHPKVGRIVKQLTVPEPINDFVTEPELILGKNNESNYYTVKWDNYSSDALSLTIHRFENSKPLDSYSENTFLRGITKNEHTWYSDPYLVENGKIIPQLLIAVTTLEIEVIESLSENSYISVAATSSASKSNF